MRPLTSETAGLFAPLLLSANDRLQLQLDRDANFFIAEIFGVWSDGGRTTATWEAYKKFPARIPERKHISGTLGGYSFAATDVTVAIINAVWPREQIIFVDEDSEVAYDYLALSSARKDQVAHVTADFKKNGTVPAHSFLLHEEFTLARYQQLGLVNSAASEGYALFMEQGTGKTPIVIARVCNEAMRCKHMYRCAVVAPKNVRLNWAREFSKFSTVPGKVTVMRGSEMDRAKHLVTAMTREDGYEYSVVIMSYESLQRSWSLLQMVEWDLAVLDESHYIKSPYTKRWKYAQKLRDRSKARMCLTGTPITNTPLDLFTQFEFLGKGWSGFHSWKNFRSFYGVFNQQADGHDRLVGMQNLPFMRERLARQSFIIRKEEALPDLPDKVYDIFEVEMTDEQSDLYRRVATELAVEIEDDMANTASKQLVVNNVLTKLLRLAQITSGFITWNAQRDEEGEVIVPKSIDRLDPNPKLEGLIELLKEKGPYEKTLVWACWVQDIRTIAARLELEGIKHVTYYGATSDADRAEAERAFNEDPETKVFIGNPAAGGTGLNLLGHPPAGTEDYPASCTHEIYFSQNWSATARSQSEDRAHRRGTRNNVRITDLCVPQTIDEEIRVRVMRKIDVALQVSDIRAILMNVLKGIDDEL